MYKLYKLREPENEEQKNIVLEAMQYTGSDESYQAVVDEYYPIKDFERRPDGSIHVPELDKEGNEHVIEVGNYMAFYSGKDENGVYYFTTKLFDKESFEANTVQLTGIEEVTLTEGNMKYVSELGDKFDVDLGMPVTKESKPDIFKEYGPCLFSLGFTQDAGAILKADGTYTFIFNYDEKTVQMKVNKKDERHNEV